MGAGVALEAKRRHPSLPIILGQAVTGLGNEPFWIVVDGEVIVSFPTKHHWKHPSDIRLIESGATKIAQMRALTDRVVVMPRPGCGNGGLRWSEVRPVLVPILDDRFHVITF